MLHLLSATDELAVFDACYRVRADGLGPPRWERLALPAEGGAAEQPARTMAALEIIERASNEELARRVEESRNDV